MWKLFKRLWQAPPAVRPICGHWAIIAAKAWLNLKGDDVRIAHGIGRTGRPHVQAQACIDGEWKWLIINYPWVETGRKDTGFEPNRYFELQHFWENWGNYV